MSLRVVEFVRGEDGIWSLPRALVEAAAAEFPEVEFRSPPDRAAVERELPEADVVLGWAVRRENFGVVAPSATSGYLCTSYTVEGETYSARFVPYPGTTPAWGTAILS